MSILIRLATASVLAITILVLPCVSMASAQEDQSGPYHSEETIANTGYSVGMLAGYGIRLGWRRNVDLAVALPYVGFPISGVMGKSFYRGVLEYKVEPTLGVITNMGDRGEVGLSPIGLKYNFTAFNSRFVPYVEGLLGAVYANLPDKMQGTRFNFIESCGLGAQYFVTDRTAVNLQARFRHLSNAGIKEPNPGINSVFLLLGLVYY